jgi:hypothetical protein
MAELKRIRPLAVAVLWAGVCVAAFGQTTGSLGGRLTSLSSAPLSGITIVAHLQQSSFEARAVTAKNGSYCFQNLPAGLYTLTADQPELGHGELNDIPVQAGHEAHVQAAMAFAPQPPEEQPRLLAGEEPQNTAPPPLPAQTIHPPGQAKTATAVSALPSTAPAASAASHTIPPLAAPRSLPVQASPVPPALAAPAPTPSNSIGLTGEEVRSLPTSGRHWEDFALDTPHAASAPGSERTSLAGPGYDAAETTLDGMNTQLAFGGAGQRTANPNGQNTEPDSLGQPWAHGRGLAVSEEAIRSLNTTASNVARSSSRGTGGRIAITTVSGTEHLHGEGFVYDRQNLWGARNPFTTLIEETAAATSTNVASFGTVPYTPPSHELTVGLGLGSRLFRKNLFWFAALDGNYKNDPGVSGVKHPSLFFAAPTTPRLELLSGQIGSKCSNVYECYSSMMETLAGLTGEAQRTASQWVGFGRVDWQINERQQLNVEATAAYFDSPGGGMTQTSEVYGTHSYGHSQSLEQWLLGRWQRYLTPNLLTASQISVGHTVLRALPETPSAYEQTLNISDWGQLPQITVDSSYGFTIGNPSRFGQGDFPDELATHLEQSLDWSHGNLLVRSGASYDHDFDEITLLRNQTGSYHYANVANFITDALAFQDYGYTGELDASSPHNCDARGKAWYNSSGGLEGIGSLPCYSYYSQTMGPARRHVSTNQWAAYSTAQWQPVKFLTLSAGMRWEREQLPAPLRIVNNPELPLTEQTPNLGSNWAPRFSLALGKRGSYGPVLRLGYGIYYGRISNSVAESVLTQTGSTNADLRYFFRPTDNLYGGGAPPFPYVLSGSPGTYVKPAALEFAPNFKNPEVHQAEVAVEQRLPAKFTASAAAMISLGRRLPVTVDTNIDTTVNPGSITYALSDASALGAIKIGNVQTLTVPFYATWPSTTSSSGTAGRANPDYQQVVEMESRANSTYEAATLQLTRVSARGLTLHAHYTYSHAMDWNPNESTNLLGGSMMDPTHFRWEYGTSNLDTRHTASVLLLFEPPWKLAGQTGRIANGWRIAGVGQYRSGQPYTMRTGGSIPKTYTSKDAAIVGLGPGLNGLGGDNRIYGTGSDGKLYNLGRNTYRYPDTWKLDLRLSKRIPLRHERELELLAESFNLFNHQNVTELETTGYTIESSDTAGGLPTLTFMNGAKTGSTAFGQPLNVNSTNFFQPRQIDFGLRYRF